jgi:hypothetical protein
MVWKEDFKKSRVGRKSGERGCLAERLRLEMCMKKAETFLTLHLSSKISINQIDKNH